MAEIDRRKKINEFMKSMGNAQSAGSQMEAMEQIASKYGDKKEEEMMEELQKLNIEIMKDNKKYKQQLDAVNQLKNFLDDGQKTELERIMDFLNNGNSQ